MTQIKIYSLGARDFSVTLHNRYIGYVRSQPVKGAVGTNGRKGGWIVEIGGKFNAEAPASLQALNGARFIRSTEAFAALEQAAS